jgi:hypothetical protein
LHIYPNLSRFNRQYIEFAENNNRRIPKYIKKIIVEIKLAKAILRWAGEKRWLKKEINELG